MTRTKAERCEIDGCGRSDIQAHGWCQMHYYRWRRHGDPTVRKLGVRVVKEKSPKVKAERPTECVIDSCDKKVKRHQRFCSMHVARIARHGSPDTKLKPGNASGPDHPSWNPDGSYTAVHRRLRKKRGPASAHMCAACLTRQARQWAYDHLDPDQKAAREGWFSTKLSHYHPLCVSCHKRSDLARLGKLRTTA